MIEVTEYTDPTCSWAWGSEPKLRKLTWSFGDHFTWRRVMGGLLPYGWPKDFGVYDPEYFEKPEWRRRASRYFAEVSEVTGMPYPGRIDWQPRSSIEMCRAVKAAERQGAEVAGRLLRRLREDHHVFGRPSDFADKILATAAAVPGLDIDRLARELDDAVTEATWQADWEETRNPNEVALNWEDDRVGMGRAREQDGRMRYGFVTLIFKAASGEEQTVPGWKPFEAYLEALEALEPGFTARARPAPTPADAFARWPLLTRQELDTVCGPGAEPPPDAVHFDSGGGAVWMTPAEAATREAILQATG